MEDNSQLTFLLADSQLERLDATGAMLQEMGYFNFLEAEDGQEAWAMISNFKVDFVISAMNLNEINGLSLLRVVRSNDGYADTPFVLLGEELTASLVAKAGRAGVSDIVVLPLKADVFKDKIKSILSDSDDPGAIEAERLYDQGVEMLKAGRYEEALKSFEGTLSVQENAEVYFNMGYIKTAKGQWGEAIHFFRRATQINNGYAKAYKMMAEAYNQLGDREAAEENLHLAADIYIERKQDAEAEDALLSVLQLRPDTINVYNSLGIVYRRQHRFEEAAKMYEKAMKVHPKDENVYYNLARVYLEMKEFGKAGKNLKKAIEINPRFTAAKELARVAELNISLSH